MTKLEIIYDVKEKLQINTDDDIFTDEYIGHLIDVKRSLLIKQAFSNLSKPIPVSIMNEVCLTLEVVEVIPGMPLAGNMLRSKQILPKVINVSGREDMITVRGKDLFSIAFNSIQMERFPYLGNNRFLSNQIYVALNSDGRLYFYSVNEEFKFLTAVTGKGVFESPSEANKFLCNTACDELDAEYPIESYMIDDIVALIRRDLSLTLQIPNDNKNDATADRKE